MTTFVYRSWPADLTERLKQLWWQGKTAAECSVILGTSSARATYEKVHRSGFKRDPQLLKPAAPELLPVSHETTGEPVTIENCTLRQCRWPYGLPAHDMVLCGRPTVKGPWCPEHRAVAYPREGAAK